LISASILILELAFIRLIPAEVRAISYFRNLILMAALFGLGLGCILQEGRNVEWLLPGGLLLVFAVILCGRGIVIYPQSSDVHYWLMYGEYHGQPLLSLLPAAMIMFVAVATPCVGMGQALAREMAKYDNLIAYGWDLGGSLVGVVLFHVTSLWGAPPWMWPAIIMVLWAASFGRTWSNRLVCPATGIVFVSFANAGHSAMWSPYYLVHYEHTAIGTRIWVNSGFHQFGFDFNVDKAQASPLLAEMVDKWNVPYDFYRAEHAGRSPHRVLVLGAGTGNDIAVALANGAAQVEAVEIDPAILDIGRHSNARSLHADRRVTFHLGDARQMLQTARGPFDMIVFGTLDSHALLSAHSNLRLENYVYTREALLDARKLVSDRGIVAVFYSVQKDWLYQRIYSTFRAAFGNQSRLVRYDNHDLFNTLLVGTKGNPGLHDDAATIARYGSGQIATDDWPFIYLERPGIGGLYWKLFGFVIVLVACVFAMLRRRHLPREECLDLFLMGMGFTLVEATGIVGLALLFGNTWTVHTAVFSSILAMMFIANCMVQRGWVPRARICWTALCLAVMLNYWFPTGGMLGAGWPLRVATALPTVGIPVYFASVCWSRSFQSQRHVGYALGVNLIGAMIGGWLEYLSMVFGLRFIWLLILAVYIAAWCATRLNNRQSSPVGSYQCP
jgi:SAM-dependent methyltransferase